MTAPYVSLWHSLGEKLILFQATPIAEASGPVKLVQQSADFGSPVVVCTVPMTDDGKQQGEPHAPVASLAAWTTALTAVDSHSEATEQMNASLSDGYFALSREQLSGYAAMLRLSSKLFDAREDVKASLRVTRNCDGTLNLFDAFQSPGPNLEKRHEETPCADGGHNFTPVSEREGLRRRKPSVSGNSRGSKSLAEQSDSDIDVKEVSAKVPSRTSPVPSAQPRLRHTLHAMPSAALREAAECFERAVLEAIAVANAATAAKKLLEEVGDANSKADREEMNSG